MAVKKATSATQKSVPLKNAVPTKAAPARTPAQAQASTATKAPVRNGAKVPAKTAVKTAASKVAGAGTRQQRQREALDGQGVRGGPRRARG
jgi:hypothetical protein